MESTAAMKVKMSKPPLFVELVDWLKETGYDIKKEYKEDYSYFIVARKVHDSLGFELKIEYEKMNESGIVLYCLQCLDPIPSHMYPSSLELVNRLNVDEPKSKYAICPKHLRLSCTRFISLPSDDNDNFQFAGEWVVGGVVFLLEDLAKIFSLIKEGLSPEEVIKTLHSH